MKTSLAEGGNIFKTADNQSATQRIEQKNVESTVGWLEKITGLPLTNNMLGTTGKKSSSGDLDLAVDEKTVSKQQLVSKLSEWVSKQGENPSEWITKSGISVHFKTPINGDSKNGLVQTDFMFGNPEWMKFSLAGEYGEDNVRGEHRHILLSSIAKAQGMKWSFKNGLLDRETGELITKDPNEIAKRLLGQTATAEDISSFSNIIQFIKKLPKYTELTADARETLAKQGIELPDQGQLETFRPGSPMWMRQLMDSIR